MSRPQRRRSSIKYSNVNPLEGVSGAALASLTDESAAPGSYADKAVATPAIPAVTAADKPINGDEFESLAQALRAEEANDSKIRILVGSLNRKLFTSAQIMVLLETTPSVKTRLQIATEILGPRCADPTAATVVVDSFRFAAEKETVSEVFKGRERVLKTNVLGPSVRSRAASCANAPPTLAGSAGVRGGRGGRGNNVWNRQRSTTNLGTLQENKEAPGSPLPSPSSPMAQLSEETSEEPSTELPASSPSTAELSKVDISAEPLATDKTLPEVPSTPETETPKTPATQDLQSQPAQSPDPPSAGTASPSETPPTAAVPPAAKTPPSAAPPPSPHAEPTFAPAPSPPPPAETPSVSPTSSLRADSAAPPTTALSPLPEPSPPLPPPPPSTSQPPPSSSPETPATSSEATNLPSSDGDVGNGDAKASPHERGLSDSSSSSSAGSDSKPSMGPTSTPQQSIGARSSTVATLSDWGKKAMGRASEDFSRNSSSSNNSSKPRPTGMARQSTMMGSMAARGLSSIGGSGILEQPGADAEGAAHSGWMHRKAGMMGQSWELKFFVLQRDPSCADKSFCLYVYKDNGYKGKLAKDAVPLAKINIRGGSLEKVAGSQTTWYSFEVKAANGKAHSFRVSREDDHTAWCQHIRTAVSSS